MLREPQGQTDRRAGSQALCSRPCPHPARSPQLVVVTVSRHTCHVRQGPEALVTTTTGFLPRQRGFPPPGAPGVLGGPQPSAHVSRFGGGSVLGDTRASLCPVGVGVTSGAEASAPRTPAEASGDGRTDGRTAGGPSRARFPGSRERPGLGCGRSRLSVRPRGRRLRFQLPSPSPLSPVLPTSRPVCTEPGRLAQVPGRPEPEPDAPLAFRFGAGARGGRGGRVPVRDPRQQRDVFLSRVPSGKEVGLFGSDHDSSPRRPPCARF